HGHVGVVSRRGDSLAVGRKRQGNDRALVSSEQAPLLPRGGVAEVNLPILSAGRKDSAIGAESWRVTGESSDQFLGLVGQTLVARDHLWIQLIQGRRQLHK